MSSRGTNGDITRRYIEKRYKKQGKTYEDIKTILNDCSHLRERIHIPSTFATKTKPKALFILGPAGSGKSYVINQLLPNPLPRSMYLYNPDQYTETLMELFQLPKKDDVAANADLEASIREAFPSMDIDDEQMKDIKDQWAAGMIRWFLGQGKTCSFQDFNAIVKAKASIVIDRPGDSLTPKTRNPNKTVFDKNNSVYQQMQHLYKNGYQIYIVLVTASEETCVKRNNARMRSLPEGVVRGICDRFNDLIPAYQDIARQNKWPLMLYDNNEGVSPSKRITLAPGTPPLAEWLSNSA
jgi:predicted ABC-type ATPase